jgi:type IV pilus assembly protein PilE
MKNTVLFRASIARRMRGVTLLELMVVVVVIGVLAAVAIPSYRQYTMRSQRTEAKSALLRLQANQERFYFQNNSYTNDLTALGFPGGKSENGVYTLNVVHPTGAAVDFRATATPTAGGGSNGVNQTSDADCQQFSIDNAGVRGATPNAAGRCW